MRRFYLPPHECQSDLLALTGGEARHAAEVLRIRPGEDAAILDGEGREFICRAEKIERKKVEFEVLQTVTSPPSACRITLIQAIPKGKIMESIIQKATELGIWRVIPLLSERVATHLEGESVERKAEKWRQTAVEAIKQCGQRWLPKVEAPIELPALLDCGGQVDLALIGSLQNGARHPREYFLEYDRKHGHRPASVAAWIGPEGDFSPGEVEAIEKSGVRPITLGPLVLRSETAATYVLSIINYELSV
ncbi:MAG TPA: RsmE family RNA methyltransferase [Verrucomicrobiae bacterium]|jgi:16S rRNA (uracil1498-N3)-methyltransferase|nr:RsmE family RNA methyltransferase [Verrucomicrobiae bacterium]